MTAPEGPDAEPSPAAKFFVGLDPELQEFLGDLAARNGDTMSEEMKKTIEAGQEIARPQEDNNQ